VTEKATRFMRENTFNGNLVVHGNTTKDGRIRYRMQDDTIFLMGEKDVETLGRYGFKPRFLARPAEAATRRAVTHG
jgi:hypothetical protein